MPCTKKNGRAFKVKGFYLGFSSNTMTLDDIHVGHNIYTGTNQSLCTRLQWQKQLQMWLNVLTNTEALPQWSNHYITYYNIIDLANFQDSHLVTRHILAKARHWCKSSSAWHVLEGHWSISRKVALKMWESLSTCIYLCFLCVCMGMYMYVWSTKKPPISKHMYVYDIWYMHVYQYTCMCPHLVRSVWDFVRHFKTRLNTV